MSKNCIHDQIYAQGNKDAVYEYLKKKSENTGYLMRSVHLCFMKQAHESEFIDFSHTARVYYENLTVVPQHEVPVPQRPKSVTGFDCQSPPLTYLKNHINIIFPSPF
jgi:hypothetical protein